MNEVRRILSEGDLTLVGHIPSASNATLVCDVELDGSSLRCVYKPVRGEAPLWDFPDGTLAGREVAAAMIDDALGWGLIPETVLRDAGPPDADLGPGMLQRWIHAEADPPPADSEPPAEPERPAEPAAEPVEVFPSDAVPDDYTPILRLSEDDGSVVVLAHSTGDDVYRLAVLDVLLNNADRKGGHMLVDADGRLWGIDHGISLHREPKLRTLLWGWAGEPVTEELREDLRRFADSLGPDDTLRAGLSALISDAEIDALRRRATKLADGAPLPLPPAARAIPWPPF
ncbi:MAG: SCO1664 family protein [Gordonia sp. (in: high G+C Gram-positive bacteria)]